MVRSSDLVHRSGTVDPSHPAMKWLPLSDRLIVECDVNLAGKISRHSQLSLLMQVGLCCLSERDHQARGRSLAARAVCWKPFSS